MQRIMSVIAAAALTAAMLLVMALPAFATKGGFGKTAFTGDCEDQTQYDCSGTRAGKQGNITGS